MRVCQLFQHPRGVQYQQLYPSTTLVTDIECKCVASAGRDGREKVITSLKEFPLYEAGTAAAQSRVSEQSQERYTNVDRVAGAYAHMSNEDGGSLVPVQ